MAFDPKKYLDKKRNSASIPDQQTISKIESLLRGGKQGASFGYGDEITGGVESLLGSLGVVEDKTYEQARDEARAADELAQQANPMSYGAGQVAGGVAGAFLPGAAALNAAKGIGGAVAVGAGLGGLAGAGESKAGITDSQFYEDLLKGAGIGAVTGGVMKGVSTGVGKIMPKDAKKTYEMARAGKSIIGDEAEAAGTQTLKSGIKALADKLDEQATTAGKKLGEFRKTNAIENNDVTGMDLYSFGAELKNEFGDKVNGIFKELSEAALPGKPLTGQRIQDLRASLEKQIEGANLVGSGKDILNKFDDIIAKNNPSFSSAEGKLAGEVRRESAKVNRLEKLGGVDEKSYSSEQGKAIDKMAEMVQQFKGANKGASTSPGIKVDELSRITGETEAIANLKDLGNNLLINDRVSNVGLNPVKVLSSVLKGNIGEGALESLGDKAGKTARFVNKPVDMARTALNKIGANSPLGQKLTSVLNMEPTEQSRALFILTQQPWFRNLTKDENEK